LTLVVVAVLMPDLRKPEKSVKIMEGQSSDKHMDVSRESPMVLKLVLLLPGTQPERGLAAGVCIPEQTSIGTVEEVLLRDVWKDVLSAAASWAIFRRRTCGVRSLGGAKRRAPADHLWAEYGV
jgi:hypothetical protein